MALRLSDLTVLSETEQIHALTALTVDPSPARAQIRRYELRYEIPSEEMRRQVAAGQMKETAEIADWLFWLESQSNHVSR
jgi:DNA-binding transcriptional regulator YdaS (Cro superfamily)